MVPKATKKLRYSIDLPFPISINGLYRVVRGKPILSAQYRAWIAEADALVLSQRIGPPQPLLTFSAAIFLCAAQRKRRDIDNLAKAVFDYAERVELITNDRACNALLMAWSDQRAPTGCRLVLWGET